MGIAASITHCARSITKSITTYRHRQEVRRLHGWERKYRKLASLLQGPRASLAGQIKKDIPALKKRALKSRRKLNKILPQAEKSLTYALETIDYLADLRARLVKASERIDRSPIGLNPPFEVRHSLLFLFLEHHFFHNFRWCKELKLWRMATRTLKSGRT